MAGAYKSQVRNQRGANTEKSFLMGMMDTQGALTDGYVKRLVNFDIVNEGQNLQPRPGLRTSKLFIPNSAAESVASDFHSLESGYRLHYSTMQVEEDGRTHYQFIAGECEVEGNEGTLYALTGQEAMTSDAADALAQKMVLNPDTPEDAVVLGYSMLNTLESTALLKSGCFFNKPTEAKIHNIPLAADSANGKENIANIIGTEAFGRFYFLTPDKKELVGVDESLWPAVKMRCTRFDTTSGLYILEDVPIASPSATEASSYGLNMLLDDPESFPNVVDSGVTECDLQGLLLYDQATGHVELYPRKNKEYDVTLNYAIEPSSDKWLIRLFWREQADVSWNEFYSFRVDMTGRADGSDLPDVVKGLMMPTDSVVIRAEVYKQITDLTGLDVGIDYFMRGGYAYDIATTATVLGGYQLDVTAEKMMQNTEMINYDLLTASGMGEFKNRVFVYGVQKDPKLLFFSDLNNPGYFPFPTNVLTFKDPIIHVTPSLDTMIVITTKQAVQVTLGPDGASWYTTVVQDHLSLAPWDKQLVQPVKNMVLFKSGNYYYMLVPKATSMTGELALAPISKPITEFLDNFQENIDLCVGELYPSVNVRDLALVNYFNYLDYEDVHNVYVYKLGSIYLHADLQYNYVTRAWKLSMYENSQIVRPFENNATQRGELIALTPFEHIQVQVFTTLETNNIEGVAATTTSEVTLLNADLDIRDAYNLRFTPEGGTPIDFTTKEFDEVTQRFIWSNVDGQEMIVPAVGTDNYGIRIRQTDNVEGHRIPIPANWTLSAYVGEAWVVKASGNSCWPALGKVFNYTFEDPLELGSVMRVLGTAYAINNIIENDNGIDEYQDTTPQGQQLIIKQFGTTTYQVAFDLIIPENTTPVIQTSSIVTEQGSETTGRGVQMFKYNSYSKKDYYIVPDKMIYCPDNLLEMTPAEQAAAMEEVAATLGASLSSTYEAEEEAITFKNWQYLDSGNRDYLLENNKRYRELQLFINNIDRKALDFSLTFSIDGENCNMVYDFTEEQLIDFQDPRYGLLYLTPNPVISNVAEVGNTTSVGQWILDNPVYPDINLWKVRMAVGGKGYSPRFKLISRNSEDFVLMKYTWVSRLMNLR